MKHLTSASGTRLIVLTLGIGCLAVLGLMLWASNPASASRTDLRHPGQRARASYDAHGFTAYTANCSPVQ